ncbi:MAG: nitrous oxide reductase family maturation protein NosD [Candidatus Hermodarchaeota archaeon]
MSGVLIFIDGDGTNNWNWASSQPWCQESGTLADPYIIENLVLNANGPNSCIIIRNSNVYFTIRNCTMFNALYGGIELFNVERCEIINNEIFNNTLGITLENCEWSFILGKSIIYNQVGMLVEQCGFTNITENQFLYGHSGINTTESGASIIFNNTIKYNVNAISQIASNYSSVYYNNIVNNTEGIYLDTTFDSQISQNILENTSHYGIFIRSCTKSLIFQNEFISNLKNAHDEFGINNQWNYTDIGNFWSDYLGVDADDDGIRDIPYLISGNTESYDYYPIWDDGPG